MSEKRVGGPVMEEERQGQRLRCLRDHKIQFGFTSVFGEPSESFEPRSDVRFMAVQGRVTLSPDTIHTHVKEGT